MNDNSKSWPKKGEQLFKSDIDRWHNACLNYCHDSYELYTLGYKRAADLLAEHILRTRRNQDVLVYPLVFLYRQYIELRLKELIKSGNLLLETPRRIPPHHKIDELWEQCRKILEKIFPEENSEDFSAVEECIIQFSEKDHISMAFRYPTDKKGKKLLPSLTHINLKNFSRIMDNLASLLDSVSMGISHYLDLKSDMRRSI